MRRGSTGAAGMDISGGGPARACSQKILRAGRKLIDVVEGKMYYGVKTGLNEAFIIDQATATAWCRRSRQRRDHQARAARRRPAPLVPGGRGPLADFHPAGYRHRRLSGVRDYLAGFRIALEPRPRRIGLKRAVAMAAKPARYKWYEIQDSVDYYRAFDGPKIFWPDICKLPRFSWDTEGKYVNDKGSSLLISDPHLLGILQSRVTWFAVSQLCQPLRLRAGLWQYRMFTQFISRLPIPD